MNWLRNRFTTIFIFTGGLILYISDYALIPGTLVLIGATMLLMTVSDAAYNSIASSARRMRCPRQLRVETLYEALQSSGFGPWGTVRMARIWLIPGPVVLLESPNLPNYFYIYRGLFGRKLYVATSTAKSRIRKLPAQRSTDSGKDSGGQDALSAPQVMRMLCCACRNYIEDGTVRFLPTENMLREEEDTPPAPIAACLAWQERLHKSRYYGIFLSGLGLLIGILWICSRSVTIPDENWNGAYSAVMLFVVLPSAVLLFAWGLFRQLKEWLRH